MRSRLLFLFSALLLFSCQKEKVNEEAPVRVNIAEIKFPETKIALVGNARELASTWEEYNAFEIAMENYDHSSEATLRMATTVANMRQEILLEFNNQPVRSRLLVLETRLKRYASFLGYTNKPEADYKTYYSDIIQAVDELNGQLNEKALVDRLEQELIEELKSDLRDLNAVPNDSLP